MSSDPVQRLPPRRFPKPGDTFLDRYRIDEVLNQGGFGCVYRATQTGLNRRVAIKILRPAARIGFKDNEREEERRLRIVAQRFEREAQIVSQLRDPHTVMMHDFGTTKDGLLYMVLEYVDGDALSDVLQTQGAFEPDRAVAVVKQILLSLEEAHSLGMLHRDIKPHNIMLFEHVGRRDRVKVLDFGLAKSIEDPKFSADDPDLTDDDVLIGTPRYMSPEQIRGERLETASDIYSLGLVFYELLTGKQAVASETTMNTLARHINDVPILLPDDVSVSPELRRIVDKMMEKEIEDRYESVVEISDDLAALGDAATSIEFADFLAVEPILAFDEFDEFDEFDDVDISNNRNKTIIAALLAFLLLFAAVGFMVYSSSSSTAETNEGMTAGDETPNNNESVEPAVANLKDDGSLPQVDAVKNEDTEPEALSDVAVPENDRAHEADKTVQIEKPTDAEEPAVEKPAEKPTTRKKPRIEKKPSAAKTEKPKTTKKPRLKLRTLQ